MKYNVKRKDLKARKRRHRSQRSKINGTPERPRLNLVFSLKYIYAQLIDDTTGRVLTSATSLGKDCPLEERSTLAAARQVGQLVAEKAKAAAVTSIVFDRSGYRYHGRVKALADAVREAGLQF